MSGGSNKSAVSVAAVILPKVREVRRIAEHERSSLLDVIIWANEIEDDLMRDGKRTLRAALDDCDFNGLKANRLDSETREYQPDAPDW